ncbi:MAG: hypothetical protein SCK28_14445, partial [Bacillota bacterium]|nr:hypothetical protein [Bacillota bacterium]
VIVTIPSGENSSTIANSLVNAGVINNTKDFLNILDLFQLHSKIKAGSYQLEKNMDLGILVLVITGMK